MRNRCYNPNVKGFENYGGRGITVCDRWRRSFEHFVEDMGYPEPGMTIERRDNDGHYTPENCVWATRKTQAINRRWCHSLTLNGETHNLIEWAAITGISRGALYQRMRVGMPIERILSTDHNWTLRRKG